MVAKGFWRYAATLPGDTPPVPTLREQLWALRPGLDGGVPAIDDFTPDAHAAVGAWGRRARSGGVAEAANSGGFGLGTDRPGAFSTHTCFRRLQLGRRTWPGCSANPEAGVLSHAFSSDSVLADARMIE